MNENEIEDEELELHNYNDENKVYLKTHERISQDLCGEITTLESGYVELRLTTIAEMLADEV